MKSFFLSSFPIFQERTRNGEIEIDVFAAAAAAEEEEEDKRGERERERGYKTQSSRQRYYCWCATSYGKGMLLLCWQHTFSDGINNKEKNGVTTAPTRRRRHTQNHTQTENVEWICDPIFKKRRKILLKKKNFLYYLKKCSFFTCCL